MNPMAVMCCFFCFLLSASSLAFSQPTEPPPSGPRLIIRSLDGDVAVIPKGFHLSEDRLARLQNYVEKRLSKTPFAEVGKLTLVLKNHPVEQLEEIFAQTGELPPHSFESRMDQFWQDMAQSWERSWEKSEDDQKVVVGQTYETARDTAAGRLVLIGTQAELSGSLQQLTAVGSQVVLHPSAQIEDQLLLINSELVRAPNSEILAQEFLIEFPLNQATFDILREHFWSGTPPFYWEQKWPGWVIGVLSLTLLFALGAIYIYLFPTYQRQTTDYLMAHPWPSLGFGVLGYLAIFPAFLLLVFTLIGILLVPLYFVIVALLFLAGYFTVANLLGRLLTKGRPLSAPAVFFLGLVLLKSFGWIPFLGWVVPFLSAFGFGAVLRILFTPLRKRKDVVKT